MSKICNNCKTTNPDDAMYCAECGTQLTSTAQKSHDIDPLYVSAARTAKQKKDSWLSKAWEWLLDQFLEEGFELWDEDLELWINLIRAPFMIIFYLSKLVLVIGVGLGLLGLIIGILSKIGIL